MNTSQLNFLTVSAARCLGCKGCELACAGRRAQQYAHFGETPDRVLPRLQVTQWEQEKFPAHCRHCENAFCLQLCPVKAIEKKDGVVLIEAAKCTGCGICQQGCPYGMIQLVVPVQAAGKKLVADKCDLCYDRQQNSQLPLCYSACPTRAIELTRQPKEG